MKQSQVVLLDAATSIGRDLCLGAFWHQGRCNWVGRSPHEAADPGRPITARVTALGPDLYAGTAGIALFLGELYGQTQLEEVRRTALGAIRHALWKAEGPNGALGEGFYSGLVGIAYAASRVGMLIDDEWLVRAGVQLASRTVSRTSDESLLDVMSGNAGVVSPLLRMARLPGGEKLHASAIALADELAAAATRTDSVWSWENGRATGGGVGATPLCGMAHGASGMGLALIEIGAQCRRDDLIEGGLAAFLYEDRLYDEEQGNWPDLRDMGTTSQVQRDPIRTSSMIAWCHGAAGIGLARLRATELLPGRSSELRVGITRAISATAHHLQELPMDADASPCHGRAGVAETLMYASEVLGVESYAEQVADVWNEIVAAREPDWQWPCGVASGRNNPSLLVGHAGVGYGLLRAAEPHTTPSVLVIS